MKITSFVYISLAAILALSITACKKENSNKNTSIADAAETSGTWSFIPMSSMICRNGSTTGFSIKLQANSSKLLIYLQGGGACYNDPTCQENPDRYSKRMAEEHEEGIFSEVDANNPFKDWNMVYVPYCTGDVHFGTNTSADIPSGPNNQNMVGSNNFRVVITELQSYFAAGNQLDELVLTGSSAGGYGTLANAAQLIDAFPSLKITVINDAGPILIDDTAQSTCMEQRWEELFKPNVPSDFDQYLNNSYSSRFKALYEYLSNKYPNVNFGLICALEDAVIRGFFGYGSNDCANMDNGQAGSINATVFSNALISLRDNTFANFPNKNWKTYYIPGEEHTFNGDAGTVSVNGTSYFQWIDALRNGTAADVQ